MQEYLERQYYMVFFLLLGIIAGGAFYAGYLEGKGSGGDSVVLSCSENILSQLQVPVKTLSSPPVKSAREAAASAADGVGSQSQNTPAKGKYVGSKNGTKYYLPSCATVKRIKPENYIWFQDVHEAQLQGYTQGKC